jgi:hypothetical protein
MYVCIPPSAVVLHPHHGKSISEQCALNKQLLFIKQAQPLEISYVDLLTYKLTDLYIKLEEFKNTKLTEQSPVWTPSHTVDRNSWIFDKSSLKWS